MEISTYMGIVDPQTICFVLLPIKPVVESGLEKRELFESSFRQIRKLSGKSLVIQSEPKNSLITLV